MKLSCVPASWFMDKRTVRYDGGISVEEFSRTGEQGFRQAVRFVRDAWAAA